MTDEIKQNVFTMLGEVAGIFTKQDIKGIDMVMPVEQLRSIGDKLIQDVELKLNEAKTAEIQLADDKLKNEYGEDWLTYRDDRLKELENERNNIHSAIPSGRPSVDVPSDGPRKVGPLQKD